MNPDTPSKPAPVSARHRVAFAAALVLFLGWLGWLGYLAVKSHDSMVLSRPQFLVSDLDVIADIERLEKPTAHLVVKQVHWPRTAAAQELVGTMVTITNLAECDGFREREPGDYILPLKRGGEGTYKVASIPPSPGFESFGPSARPRIYKLTPETQRQLDAIPKPEAGR